MSGNFTHLEFYASSVSIKMSHNQKDESHGVILAYICVDGIGEIQMRKSKVLLAALALWLVSVGQVNAVAILDVAEYRYSASVPPPGWVVVGDIFTASLDARIENSGIDDAYNVTALLIGVAVGVTLLDSAVVFGDIPAGGTTWSADLFS